MSTALRTITTNPFPDWGWILMLSLLLTMLLTGLYLLKVKRRTSSWRTVLDIQACLVVMVFGNIFIALSLVAMALNGAARGFLAGALWSACLVTSLGIMATAVIINRARSQVADRCMLVIRLRT